MQGRQTALTVKIHWTWSDEHARTHEMGLSILLEGTVRKKVMDDDGLTAGLPECCVFD